MKWCKKDGDHYVPKVKKMFGKMEGWASEDGRTGLVCPECGCVGGVYVKNGEFQ